LLSADMMMSQARRVWNPAAKPPLEKWLVKKQSEQDRSRLTAVGNIVMPRVAQLAIHMLSHHLRSRSF
jgi:hypothetical protein